MSTTRRTGPGSVPCGQGAVRVHELVPAAEAGRGVLGEARGVLAIEARDR